MDICFYHNPIDAYFPACVPFYFFSYSIYLFVCQKKMLLMIYVSLKCFPLKINWYTYHLKLSVKIFLFKILDKKVNLFDKLSELFFWQIFLVCFSLKDVLVFFECAYFYHNADIVKCTTQLDCTVRTSLRGIYWNSLSLFQSLTKTYLFRHNCSFCAQCLLK